MVAIGDPRGSRETGPTPQPGAPCGVVDFYDFPLDPPDGDGARGGTDFGIYRSRFNGYHTGEDWGLGYRSSFGASVHAIAHGTVSYAAPLGWGADQGTIVIRHALSNGTVVYSFYGHLDPPSVALRAGECVTRGMEIGRIGRPRTPPHLHFEIRLHLPTAPGPGYWSVDPTLAGWISPSQAIWESRLVGAPGVRWARPSTEGLHVLGTIPPHVLVGTEQKGLLGIDLRDGTILWQFPLEGRVRDAVLDVHHRIVYLVGWFGNVSAWQLQNASAEGSSEAALLPLWEVELETVGTPHLMPLPNGGVTLGVREEIFGVSATGQILWHEQVGAHVSNWTADASRLVFSTARPSEAVWVISGAEPHQAASEIGGHPVISDEGLFLYAASGVYRLDSESGGAELVYALPGAYLAPGDMIALASGDLLVAHTDRYDRRLILLKPNGTVVWDRSLAAVHNGRPSLFILEDRPLILFERDGNSSSDIALYVVDVEHKELIRILDGGTRYPQPQETWATSVGEEQLALNLAGGHFVVIDVGAAEETIRRIENAR
jgi:murein DD-endopeptidase MepM/ murein hydrolase activator NlpD